MTGRLARSLLAAALAVAGTVVPVAAASAAPASACSSSTGVLVVVDFRALGGNVQRGCDPSPSTGYEALAAAGFTPTGTQHDGPAFVCRIDGRPNASQDPCVRTPPASAYWSYWHANSGQKSWSYSTRGAMSYEPKAGSVDAWVFGATDVGGTTGGPCFSPADARAGRATACPAANEPRPTRTAKARAPKPRTSAATTARPREIDPPGRTPSTGASGTARSTSAAPGTSASTSSSAAPTTSTAPVSAPAIVDATPAAGERASDGGGSALPVVFGLLLAVVIGAAGAWTVWRRRSAADGS